MRVVSLLPSATEILYSIEVEPVAVSGACDYPPAATDRPAATRSRVDPDASSVEIDEQVAQAEAEDGVFELREDVLRRVDPDLIVTQGVCDVCAVDDATVRDTVRALDLGAEILTVHPHSLEDVMAAIGRLGELTDRADRAGSLLADLEDRIRAVEDRTPRDGPRVAIVDWMDPVMIAGHWIPEMVDLTGGRYGMAAQGDRSIPRQFDDLREYDPEVLIAAPCGFSLDQTIEHLDELTDCDGFESLSAARNDRVYAMDGHHYVNRPGPRLVDTLEYLAEILHADDAETDQDGVYERVSAPVSNVE